ncbi:MAG: hypothetical protein LBV68_04675 [Spirochaetaceae bacterium]|jgi:hypothetical protein|nr:hypothetical protein [Spirochaetaceae bacterium]
MKVQKKVILILSIFNIFIIVRHVNSLDLAGIQNDFNAYADSVINSMPLNAAVGLNWSDAYIGNLPFHFGGGVSFGTITMDKGPFVKEAANLGANTSKIDPGGGDFDKTFIPAYVLDLRFGGFGLPFDVGGKIGYLWKVEDWKNSNFGLNFIIAGCDIRFAVLKGGPVLPKVSIGLGFNYVNGGIDLDMAENTEFSALSNIKITAEKPVLDLFWETRTLEVKAQISKTIGGPVFNLYLGLGGGYAWSNAGYKIKSNLNYTNGDVKTPISQAQGDIQAVGIGGFDQFDANGFSAIKDGYGGFFRTYGGFSLNFAIIKVDLMFMFVVPGFNYGFTLGLRAQS